MLEMGGVGSRAMPNGLPESGAPLRSAQEGYDQKYFSRDAPAPQRPAPAPSPAAGSGRLARPAPSAVPMSAGGNLSTGSNYSNSGTYTEEKKKKRGFLRF